MEYGAGGIVGYSRGDISFCSTKCTIKCGGVGGGISGYSDHPISECSFVGTLIMRNYYSGDPMAKSLGGIVGYQVGRCSRYYDK